MTRTPIVSGGIQTLYSNVNDRMRNPSAETLARLTDSSGGLLNRQELSSATAVRVDEIDMQLPVLRRRRRALHYAVQFIYGAMAFLVSSMILIAIDISVPAPALDTAALVTVLLATVALLVALPLPLLSLGKSIDAVSYEMDRTLEFGSRPVPPSSSS